MVHRPNHSSAPLELERRKESNFLKALAIFAAINAMCYSFFQTYDSQSVKARAQHPESLGLPRDFSDALLSSYYLSKAKSSLADYETMDKSANIILLGSSLMLYPFWDADRSQGIKTGDVGYYHRSIFLEKRLKQDGYAASVFNWSTLLQMESDSYLIAKQFLQPNSVIVLGIAPRDFYDNVISSPADTYYFQQFASASDLLSPSLFPNKLSLVDYALHKYVPLYSDRSPVQGWLAQRAYVLFLESLNMVPKPYYIPPFYLARYKGISVGGLKVQEDYFAQLLDLAKNNHDKLLVINMPLSKSNRELLPPGFYEDYRLITGNICADKQVRFIDLADCQNEFADTDYLDGVHLNGVGAVRLTTKMLPALEQMLQADR
jgi:hypothetical protein